MNTFKCCDGCDRRVVGCRSECKDWEKAVAQYEAIKARKAEEHMVNDYIGGNQWKRKW